MNICKMIISYCAQKIAKFQQSENKAILIALFVLATLTILIVVLFLDLESMNNTPFWGIIVQIIIELFVEVIIKILI